MNQKTVFGRHSDLFIRAENILRETYSNRDGLSGLVIGAGRIPPNDVVSHVVAALDPDFLNPNYSQTIEHIEVLRLLKSVATKTDVHVLDIDPCLFELFASDSAYLVAALNTQDRDPAHQLAYLQRFSAFQNFFAITPKHGNIRATPDGGFSVEGQNEMGTTYFFKAACYVEGCSLPFENLHQEDISKINPSPFEKRFDVVSLNQVTQYIHFHGGTSSLNNTASNIAEMLKPGGIVINANQDHGTSFPESLTALGFEMLYDGGQLIDFTDADELTTYRNVIMQKP